MAGIYIHIPFCRQKCHYCDFYNTTNTRLIPVFVTSLLKETERNRHYLQNEAVNTIYFGGGTPSVLGEERVKLIIDKIHNHFDRQKNAEITFEVNPDDINPEYLQILQEAGVNRLSIGIQSFNNKHLRKMNRRHDASQATNSVLWAKKSGFENISVDLIYGIPGQSNADWQNTLEYVFGLPIQHLSAYHLTFHEGTRFNNWLVQGAFKELSEKDSLWQFNQLITIAQSFAFEHYEISNFARNKMYSSHNTSYWLGKNYLGLGPSAHSYNGTSRRWNVSNTIKYIQAIEKDKFPFKSEILTENDKYNEYIITRIRTKWGVSTDFIQHQFGTKFIEHFLKNIKNCIDKKLVVMEKGTYKLTRKGIFISDKIMQSLMII